MNGGFGFNGQPTRPVVCLVLLVLCVGNLGHATREPEEDAGLPGELPRIDNSTLDPRVLLPLAAICFIGLWIGSRLSNLGYDKSVAELRRNAPRNCYVFGRTHEHLKLLDPHCTCNHPPGSVHERDFELRIAEELSRAQALEDWETAEPLFTATCGWSLRANEKPLRPGGQKTPEKSTAANRE